MLRTTISAAENSGCLLLFWHWLMFLLLNWVCTIIKISTPPHWTTRGGILLMILCPHQQQLHHASLPLALLILHSTIHTRVFFSAYWHLFLFHSIVTIYYILLFVVEGILWLVLCGMSCHDVRCQVYIYLLTSTVLEVPHNNMFMDHPFLLFCHLLSSPLSVLLFAWHY